MKILITGATGFIGANLVRRMLKEGHEVHVSMHTQSNAWRLEQIKGEINSHELDIRDANGTIRALLGIKPNAIIHLATAWENSASPDRADNIFQTNVVGTINLVRACDAINYECFINTSSSCEYLGHPSKKISEGATLSPSDYYGFAKSSASLFCQTHARITKKPIITTRLFSAYGPFNIPPRLVPQAIKSCLSNQHLKLTDGTQQRDFIYTEDIEGAYAKLLKNPLPKGEILNIGTGKRHTVREMVEEIATQTKADKSLLGWGELRPRDFEIGTCIADTTKAKKLLRWKVRFSLEQGIKKTVAWAKNNLECLDGAPNSRQKPVDLDSGEKIIRHLERQVRS